MEIVSIMWSRLAPADLSVAPDLSGREATVNLLSDLLAGNHNSTVLHGSGCTVATIFFTVAFCHELPEGVD